jgi:hypothetical protein
MLHPLVDAELVADVAALDDQKFLVEFLLQFTLPLESQVGRAGDENPIGEPSQLEFPNEKASHDGLARACVVSEQEAHTG